MTENAPFEHPHDGYTRRSLTAAMAVARSLVVLRGVPAHVYADGDRADTSAYDAFSEDDLQIYEIERAGFREVCQVGR